jgi:hypothetical protein
MNVFPAPDIPVKNRLALSVISHHAVDLVEIHSNKHNIL